MPDDVFYYLHIARSLAQTGVSTFDGETLTNGYHPGWMLLMTALAHWFDERLTLLQACLITCFVLHAMSSVLMVYALRAFCGRFWSWVGGAFWLLNPLPLRVALQGMEGTFYVWALLIAFCIFNERIARPLRSADKTLSTYNCILFGLSLGLAFWARTEALLLAVVSFLYLAGALWLRDRTPSSTQKILSISRVWLLTGGAFALCIAPWFLYSLLETGSLTQMSGAMKMLWATHDFASVTAEQRLIVMLVFFCIWWLSVASAIVFNQPFGILTIVLWLILFLVIARGVQLSRKERQKRPADIPASTQNNQDAIAWPQAIAWLQMVAWLLPVFLLSGMIYGGLFSDQRTWYWGQPGVIFFFLFFSGACLCRRIPESGTRFPQLPQICGAAVVLYGALLCVSFSRHVPTPYHLQPGAYQSLAWLQERVPPGARIGVLNAGVPAYFTNLKIVNLDGLMNNIVADRWRSREFDRYLQEARIDYIADLEVSLNRARPFSQGKLPLQKLDYHKPSQRTLWKVLRSDTTQTYRSNKRAMQ